MDELDEMVRRAAPPAWGSDTGAASEARALARRVAQTRRRRQPRVRSGFGAVVLGVGLVGFGATAAVAGPGLLAWVGWIPDASVQRTFELSGGADIGVCEVAARIVPDYVGVTAEQAEDRTESARQFLASHDWTEVVASVTAADIETKTVEEQAGRLVAQAAAEAEGKPAPPNADPGVIASSLMGDRISQTLTDAGYLQPGVSLEMAGYCSPSTEDGE